MSIENSQGLDKALATLNPVGAPIAHAGLHVAAVPTAGRPWTEIDFEADLDYARSILPAISTADGPP